MKSAIRRQDHTRLGAGHRCHPHRTIQFPEHTDPAIWAGGSLRPDIIKDLGLGTSATNMRSTRPPFISLQPDGNHLTLDAESLKRISEKDAARWSEFVRFMDKSAKILDFAYGTIMPRLPKNFSFDEGLGLAELGLDLRLIIQYEI